MFLQIKQLVAEVEEGGSILKEVGQKAESYRQSLQEQGRELERVRGVKEELEKQLASRVAELQAQISDIRLQKADVEGHASHSDLELESLRSLHASCAEAAMKMKGLLESKEKELSHVLSALQVASAQISALGRKGAGSRTPVTVTGEVGMLNLPIELVMNFLLPCSSHSVRQLWQLWRESLPDTRETGRVLRPPLTTTRAPLPPSPHNSRTFRCCEITGGNFGSKW